MLNKKRKKAKVKAVMYRRIAWAFLIASLLLVLFIIYITFAHAEIRIYPRVKTMQTDFAITANENATQEDYDAFGVIPWQNVRVQAEGEYTFDVTGEAMGESDIVAIVTLVNTYSKDQPLIKTTRLLTKDKRLFRISENITVPAGGSVDFAIYPDNFET